MVLKALPTRDAVLPIVAVLGLARECGCRMSEVARELPPRFTASDRLQNVATELSLELIACLVQDKAQVGLLLAPQSGQLAHVDTSDGLPATFANGDIVHLRPSGNAPELHCYAEASNQALAERCAKPVSSVLPRPRKDRMYKKTAAEAAVFTSNQRRWNACAFRRY